MSLPAQDIVEFGTCRYSFKSHTLLRNGSAVPLEKRAIEVLEFLILNRDRVVSRKDLISNVWKIHVGESAVDYQIAKIRNALGPAPGLEPYIKTKSGLGWQFMAEVKEVPSGNSGRGATPDRDFLQSLTNSEIGHTRGNLSEFFDPAPEIISRRSMSQTKRRLSVATIAAGTLLAGIVASVVGSKHQPHVVEFAQLTNDGRPKLGPLVTDGSRLYFSEHRDGEDRIVYVPVAGGDPVAVAGIPAGMLLDDITPDGNSLLLRRVVSIKRQDLWTYRLNTGELQTLESGVEAATWSRSGGGLTISDGMSVSSLSRGRKERLFDLSGRRAAWLKWAPGGQLLRTWLAHPGDEPLSVWDFDVHRHQMQPVLGLSTKSTWPLSGSWSRNGRSFVYAAGNDFQKNLWVLKESGVNRSLRPPARLTAGPGSWLWPTTGVDDSTIFAMHEENRSGLVKFNTGNGSWEPMWEGAPASQLDYSPDRKWIAFVHFPDQALWKARPDGSGRTRLTFDSIVVQQPHWSPDGSRIAFMGQTSSGAWRIFAVPAAGGKVEQLSSTKKEDQGVPTWSADGRYIVFGELLARKKPEEMSLWFVDVVTRTIKPVKGTQGLWSPRWSRDGRHIAAVTTDHKKIRVIDTSTSQWSDLISLWYIDDVMWSYDSNFLYFDGLEEIGKLAIYRVSVSQDHLAGC